MFSDLPVVKGLTPDQVLTLVSCRRYEQYREMLAGYLAKTCPFCDPLDPMLNRVLHRFGSWRMWLNPFPMAHTALHLVMSPEQHMTSVEQVLPVDFVAIGQLFAWAQKEYRFTGGGLAMRFGSPFESCCSVLHLHVNIIIPDKTGNAQVTLAKSPEKLRKQIARFRVYQKLDTGISLEALSVGEQQLLVQGG